MVLRAKMDSNETGLAFAEEVLGQPGTLPVTPLWFPLEPNEYDDFGGELTLLARRPINSSRQRKKGSITDLDASGGFNQDLTQTNTQKLLQGFMYASYREKPTSAIVSVAAGGYTVAAGAGFIATMLVLATGSAVAGNNKVGVVSGVAGNVVTVAGLATDTAPSVDAKLVNVGIVGGAGDLDIDAAGVFPALTSVALDFTTLGFVAGEFIFIGGDVATTRFANAACNGLKRIRSVAAHRIEFDKSATPMATVASTTETIHLYYGRVLKNEQGNAIVRRSYQLERQLGAPDTDTPNQFQAEYLKGAFGNELTINIEQADKINIDYSFVALDNEQRTATQGIKSGTRKTIPESDAYNTSTDFSGLRLAIYTGLDAAPAALFAYLLDLSITINNNVTPNKAVAVLGGFDVSLGVFEVSAEITAYFSTVEAVQAVRNNSDVTLHAFVAKSNAGFVLDMPLAALGDARLEVEIDEPITLPLAMDAATAVKLNPLTDYTLLWTFFDYLPTIAEA